MPRLAFQLQSKAQLLSSLPRASALFRTSTTLVYGDGQNGEALEGELATNALKDNSVHSPLMEEKPIYTSKEVRFAENINIHSRWWGLHIFGT